MPQVTQPHAEPELGLRDYVRVLANRRGLVLLPMVVLLVASIVWSILQTPMYEATAKVLLQPRATESLFDPTSGQRTDPVRAIETEIEVLTSGPVKSAARERLGFEPEIIAGPIGQTDVIQIVARSDLASRAAEVANTYASAYVDFRRTQVVDAMLAAIDQIQRRITDLQRQAETASDADRQTLTEQQAVFKEKLDQLELNTELQTGGAQLVGTADVPESPSSPKPVRNALLAVAFGLVLGVGLALTVEYVDDSVKTKDDLEKVLPGVPVSGMIPAVPGWKDRGGTKVVTVEEPNSPGAEAYRTLRTAVQFMGVDQPINRIQLTSSNAQEGKTTTLANLGVALARSGQRVVLMCCDLCRPRIHEFFGLSNRHGLTSVLLGEISLGAALQKTAVPRLFVLASGPLPPNPSELLASRKVADLIDRVAAEGYLVLIDSPPLLPVADAMVLSKRVDATLLVCNVGATTRNEVRRAADLLEQVNAPLMGVVLNGVSTDGGYGYSYRYYSPTTNGAKAINGATNGRPPARPWKRGGRQGDVPKTPLRPPR